MHYMDDNGIFDDQAPAHHYDGEAFVKGFAAAFSGALLGSRLDNTRFGRWFNTSPVIGLLGRLLALVGVLLVGYYFYLVIKIW